MRRASHRPTGQAVRFLIAGSLAALVNLAVRVPLSAVLPYPAAVATATVVGMAFAFFVYRRFVFQADPRPLRAQVIDFCWVNAVGAGATVLVATLVRGALLLWTSGDPEVIGVASHAVGIALGAFVNYVGHSRFTFRPAPGNS